MEDYKEVLYNNEVYYIKKEEDFKIPLYTVGDYNSIKDDFKMYFYKNKIRSNSDILIQEYNKKDISVKIESDPLTENTDENENYKFFENHKIKNLEIQIGKLPPDKYDYDISATIGTEGNLDYISIFVDNKWRKLYQLKTIEKKTAYDIKLEMENKKKQELANNNKNNSKYDNNNNYNRTYNNKNGYYNNYNNNYNRYNNYYTGKNNYNNNKNRYNNSNTGKNNYNNNRYNNNYSGKNNYNNTNYRNNNNYKGNNKYNNRKNNNMDNKNNINPDENLIIHITEDHTELISNNKIINNSLEENNISKTANNITIDNREQFKIENTYPKLYELREDFFKSKNMTNEDKIKYIENENNKYIKNLLDNISNNKIIKASDNSNKSISKELSLNNSNKLIENNTNNKLLLIKEDMEISNDENSLNEIIMNNNELEENKIDNNNMNNNIMDNNIMDNNIMDNNIMDNNIMDNNIDNNKKSPKNKSPIKIIKNTIKNLKPYDNINILEKEFNDRKGEITEFTYSKKLLKILKKENKYYKYLQKINKIYKKYKPDNIINNYISEDVLNLINQLILKEKYSDIIDILKNNNINIHKIEDLLIEINNKDTDINKIEKEFPNIYLENPIFLFKYDFLSGYNNKNKIKYWGTYCEYIFYKKGYYIYNKIEGINSIKGYLQEIEDDIDKLQLYTITVYEYELLGTKNYITYVTIIFNKRYNLKLELFKDWLLLEYNEEKKYYICSGNYANKNVIYNKTFYYCELQSINTDRKNICTYQNTKIPFGYYTIPKK